MVENIGLSVIGGFKSVLQKPCFDDNEISNEDRIVRFISILQQQNEGTDGAGLTGAAQQESLWKDMLLDDDSGMFGESPSHVTDADYSFRGVPLSHKTVGWAGGDLALSWSKNEAGLLRTTFHSSAVIIYTRKPTCRGMWFGLEHGVYFVPVDYLNSEVELSSNNKTDNLIKAREVAKMLQVSKSLSYFHPLPYTHSHGKGFRLSYWLAGKSSAVER